MRCYEVTDGVDGLFIDRSTTPRIPTPPGCVLPVRLSPAFEELLEEAPPEYCCLQRAMVTTRTDGIILEPQPPQDARKERQALVRISTAGGHLGRARLTAKAYDEVDVNGHIERKPRPFPSPGVIPLCIADEVERLRKGLPHLDVFLLMSPGAMVRIERDGQLEGASPELFVHWNGRRLNLIAPNYEEREGVGGVDVPALGA